MESNVSKFSYLINMCVRVSVLNLINCCKIFKRGKIKKKIPLNVIIMVVNCKAKIFLTRNDNIESLFTLRKDRSMVSNNKIKINKIIGLSNATRQLKKQQQFQFSVFNKGLAIPFFSFHFFTNALMLRGMNFTGA